MNWFRESLSESAKAFSPLTNVVHRRKRLDTIIAKLRKYPQMQLTTMQDIAGCRAIVKEAQELDALIAACKQQWLNHELYDESDDYIARIPEKLKAIRERLGMTPMKSRRTLAQRTAQR